MQGIAFALDIGSSKIAAVVGEITGGELQIIGFGSTQAEGVRRGMITDVAQVTAAISKVVEQAEETSGYKLTNVFINVSGDHISSLNNSGIVAIADRDKGVSMDDIHRAMDAARAVPVPHNRDILHLIPRVYRIDDQEKVKSPLGMHGFRLEVDAHIVIGAVPAQQNIKGCTAAVELNIDEFIMSSLASAASVVSEAERDMGVLVADIGAGTTDVVLYTNGAPFMTKTIPIGGQLISNDIAIGLRVPFEVGEEIKLRHGDARPEHMPEGATFSVAPFGGEKITVGHRELSEVIEARVEEIFNLISKEVKECGFTGLIPAGIVLTGGTARLKGVNEVAQKVLGVPARIAEPRNLKGLVEKLNDPAFATSIGMLRWAMSEHYIYARPQRSGFGFGFFKNGWDVIKRMLPG
ncbi:MAG: cell division protein FtsA [Candidatus Promineifilaceae bacterium]|jgi:cell division protein FtsA